MALIARQPTPWGDLDVTIPLIFNAGFLGVLLAAIVGIIVGSRDLEVAELPGLFVFLSLFAVPFVVLEVWLYRVRMLPGKVWTDGFRPAIGAVGGVGESEGLRGRLLGKTKWKEVAVVKIYRDHSGGPPKVLDISLQNGERLRVACRGYKGGEEELSAALLRRWADCGGKTEEAWYGALALDEPARLKVPGRRGAFRRRASP